jgi:hypothetical protein
MSETSARRFLWRRLATALTAAGMAIVLLWTPAIAADSDDDKVKFNWDNTISLGLAYRLEEQDPDLIGLANGGNAFSVNGDDGNLNYDTGISSMAVKWSSELQIDFGEHFGAFFRGFAFYDHEQEDGDRLRTPLSEEALERVGSRAELLDAYIWTKFGSAHQTHIRLGEQVQNWGESTFIQGGINVINPIDVSALRVPGAELKDALVPVGMAWGNMALSDNVSLEGFYQYRWEETKIDPPGSYFSTNDFAGAGGDTVMLGFATPPDIPAMPFLDILDPTRHVMGVPRESNVLPDDGGQFGLALRWFVPAMGNTELGFYYANYHSRLPLINGRTGTVDGAITAGMIGASATPITTEVLTWLAMNPGDIAGAIEAGTLAGVLFGAPLNSSAVIAGTAATSLENVAAITTAWATDAYSQTARYFLSYPEDIQLYGLSFNSQLGTSGIALQGELSYRQDAPLQADDVELLFAALAPISPIFAGTSGIPGEPGATQFADYFGEDYSTQFETVIPGYILQDVMQFQLTATKMFGPGMGADQSVLLMEAAVTNVPDMPDKNELRLEGPGTYTSGNPYHEDPLNPGAAHALKPADAAEHFADPTSWGYRIAGRMEFNNAIGAITLLPRFSWQHDVSGVSPGPGGNFIEGRMALTIGLLGVYQNKWSGDLSYTTYMGADRHNLINDRDFVAANVKYSF